MSYNNFGDTKGEGNIMAKRKTTDDIKKELYKLVGNDYTLCGKYVNAATPVNLIHKCGYKRWYTIFNKFRHGARCPICKRKPNSLAERFAYEVTFDTLGEWYLATDTNPNVGMGDKAILVNTNIKEQFTTTWKEFRVSLPPISNNLINSNISSKKDKQLSVVTAHKLIPPLVYKNKFNRKYGKEYELLSDYQGTANKIHVKHLACGFDYWVRQDKFTSEGQRCPKCQHHQSTAMYKKLLNNKSLGGYTLLDDEYMGSKDIQQYQCNQCGRKFTQRADLMLQGAGCPYCIESKGEKLVQHILEQVYHLKQDKDYIYGYILPNKLHLDFYLPAYRVGIEYDGEQHYYPVNYFGGETTYKHVVKRDKIKDKYCKEHNIKLIRIPYTQNTFNEVKHFLFIDVGP